MTDSASKSDFKPASAPASWKVGIIVGIYLLLSTLLVGFKPEQIYLSVIFCLFYFISAASRRFILAFSIFIVYWIVFDFMKSFPNYRLLPVHIESLYTAEKTIFGINSGVARLTPNEFWAQHHYVWLDLLTGFCYLAWVPVPLGFSIYLYIKNRPQFFYFSLTFFWVNLIGFLIYYLYPAAPPWYVAAHGFEFYRNTPGNVAGLARFDQFFGAGIFRSIYAKSSNVFAAMPSLHASYLLIVLYFSLVNKMGRVCLLFAFLMIGIWFSAVYNSHHYVLDVIAGVLTGAIGIITFRFGLMRNARFSKWVERYIASTR